jgi:hypothetical protein
MSITIHHIQSLLSTYHRQQIQSRLSQTKARRIGEKLDPQEDKVFISAEAKRLQIYQRTVQDVLSRARGSHPEDVKNENENGSSGR